MSQARPAVLVVGGAGYFGSILVGDLKSSGDCSVLVAGRSSGDIRMDLSRPETIGPALEGIAIVVNAAGPFQGMPLTLLGLCVDRGIHYIDLADDRDFVMRARSLARDRSAPGSAAVFPGCSAVPALSAVLSAIAVRDRGGVQMLRIQMAPGNRSPRQRATVESLLASVGRPIRLKDRTTLGWTEPRVFEFPAPVGRRRGYLVDVPDVELFPELFGAASVEFRAGAELGILNLGVSFLGLLRRIGAVRDWSPYVPLFLRAAGLTAGWGHDWGALGVEAGGRRVSVVADREGQRIAVLPAALMVQRLLKGPGRPSGLVPLESWVSVEQLWEECLSRGYRLVIEDDA